MKRLRKALWRYWKHLDAGRRFRAKRRAAGLCYQCGDARMPHSLRCRDCSEYNSQQSQLSKLVREDAAAAMPRFWKQHPELVENNDRVLQAAWEEEHA